MAVACAFAVLIVLVMRSSPRTPVPVPHAVEATSDQSVETNSVAPSRFASARTQKDLWALGSVRSIDPVLASEVERAIADRIQTPSAPLAQAATPDIRARLAHAIGTQLVARSASTSSAYFQLFNGEGYRWVSPEENPKVWEGRRLIAADIKLSPPDPSNPQAVLAESIDESIRVRGGRWVEFDGGDRSIVMLGWARTRDAIDHDLLQPVFTVEEYRVMFGGGTGGGLRLRVPIRPYLSVLSDYSQVLIADAALLIKTEGGSVMACRSKWYWDPQTSTWYCHNFWKMGRAFMRIEF